MAQDIASITPPLIKTECLSQGERDELIKLGMLSEDLKIKSSPKHPPERPPIQKHRVHAPQVLNEAYNYKPRASSFSRALSFELGGYKILLISGTASVDENGNSIHIGDFRAQCLRTYRNISSLLESGGMTWHDVVRTSCYLRDIDRDYKDFNEIRTAFFTWLGLDPLPASTGIQAAICRSDLLVEIEAIAVCETNK